MTIMIENQRFKQYTSDITLTPQAPRELRDQLPNFQVQLFQSADQPDTVVVRLIDTKEKKSINIHLKNTGDVLSVSHDEFQQEVWL
jgi:FlaG/FlaF family flagellin (archaellin)